MEDTDQNHSAGSAIPKELLRDLQSIISMDPDNEPDESVYDMGFGGHGEGLAGHNIEKELLDGVAPRKGSKTQKVVPVFKNPRVEVFDLAMPEDARSYEQVMSEICASDGKLVPTSTEMPPMIVIDPAAPRGYRAITVIRWAEASMKIIDTSQATDEVSATKERQRRTKQ